MCLAAILILYLHEIGTQEDSFTKDEIISAYTSSIQFSWRTRTRICVGIARGLAILHEEVRPHIVHRDIKATNILLDKDLTPKISDFGLPKLIPANMTQVSTRVAGTIALLADGCCLLVCCCCYNVVVKRAATR
ncbi:unnamed protein product [Camellia sinensis]